MGEELGVGLVVGHVPKIHRSCEYCDESKHQEEDFPGGKCCVLDS